MKDIVESVNRGTMTSKAATRHYSYYNELNAAEQAALATVRGKVAGGRILDIGVGSGRTTNPLLEVSRDYVGIDYSSPMVERARQRRPGVDFRHCDARDMKFLPDGSVQLAVFSCSGISMVVHEDRLAILREVHRVLAPGAAFLFSIHNQDNSDHDAYFVLPEFFPSANPLRMAVRSARFAASLARRIVNRSRYAHHSFRSREYSMINDACHDYTTFLYYITLDNQRRQLEQVGFLPGAPAWDIAGRLVTSGTTDSTIVMVAHKP